MATIVKTSSIKRYYNIVATYNADPFAVENEDLRKELFNTMDNTAVKYTQKDSEFENLCAKLDGNINTYKMIYESNGAIVGVLND